MQNFGISLKNFLFGSLSVLFFFGFWEFASRTGLVISAVIPPPTLVLQALIDSAASGELFSHMMVSLGRAGMGFLLAVVLAIPAGFIVGTYFKTVEKALLPFLRMLEKLNPFALFPVFMILFGIGNFEKIMVIFWVTQWPLLFNTAAGAKSIDVNMVRSARSMGANRKTVFLKVILPWAVPNIFTGIKISAQLAFFMIIASEMMGSSQGLGWYYLSSSQAYQIPLMYGIILFITLLAVIMNGLFTKLERHFLVWKENSFQIN